jgi:hypothetical protein
MQKTGGVSLYVRLQREFGEDAVYPAKSDGDAVAVAPQLMTDVLLERWAQRRDRIRVVTGHFPLCVVELLDADFATFTIVRDPVERTLSYLRHHRTTTPADSEKPLQAIYENPGNFKHFIDNHMVKMLSLRPSEMLPSAMMTVAKMDGLRLETAKSALEGMEAIGLQEDLEGFAQGLEKAFGWRLGPPVRQNVTAPAEVPISFRKRIAEDNGLDMQLYEHGRQLLRRRG